MKEEKLCSVCHESHPEEQLTEFCGQLMCSSCLNSETVVCSHCGKRVWNDDNYGNDGMPLCQDCYDEYYTSCSRCECIIRRDDAFYESDDEDPYCSDCYNIYVSHNAIRDYYYKPTPKFYGDNSRFFGVELEVDEAGEDNENAESVMNIANAGKEHIYCKHDGSLDDGFEIVTHPMTLNYHMDEMPWLAVVTELKEMGYLSHKANTCGLHIHVNRNSLGDTHIAQEATIARILYFFEIISSAPVWSACS